jgi:hypothetical protein
MENTRNARQIIKNYLINYNPGSISRESGNETIVRIPGNRERKLPGMKETLVARRSATHCALKTKYLKIQCSIWQPLI